MNQFATEAWKRIQPLHRKAEFEAIIAYCRPTLLDARERNDLETESVTLIGWSQAHFSLGKFYEARLLSDGALRAAREIGSSRLVAIALSNEASIRMRAALQYSEAEADYREVLRLVSDVEAADVVMDALLGMGYALQAQGNNAAENYAREAFEQARQFADPLVQASALLLLGQGFERQEQHEKALRAFQDALEFCNDHELHLIRSDVVRSIGRSFTYSTRYRTEGVQIMQQALAMARAQSNVPAEFSALMDLARVYGRLGRTQEAHTVFETVLQRAQRWQARAYEGAVFFEMGTFAYHDLRYDDASAHFEQTRTISREIMNPFTEAQAETWLGDVFRVQNDFDSALDHYANARMLYDSLDATVQVHTLTGRILRVYLQRLLDQVLRFLRIRSPNQSGDE